MRAAAPFAAVALVAAPVAAAESQGEQGTIWKGTLGGEAVTACFDGSEGGNSVFYRDGVLEIVRLEPQNPAAALVFTEMTGTDEAAGAVWTMQPASDEAMTGEWRKGDVAVPIHLKAVTVDVPEYGSACESAAFIEPLLAGGTTTGVTKKLGTAGYTELAYAGPARAGLEDYHIVTFVITPATPADEAINAMLAAVLPDGTVESEMAQCAAPMLANAGVPGYIDQAQTPMLITPRWVAVRNGGSNYCGGAHPNNFLSLAVYDRQRGAAADPTQWFKPGALAFYDFDPQPGEFRPIKGLSPALTEAVMARWPADGSDPECLEAARSEWGWTIGLSAEGPVFAPQFPHVIFACTEEVTVPWKAARPFLSKEGRAVMASLRQAPKPSGR